MACVVSQKIVKESIAMHDGKKNMAAQLVKTMLFVVIIWKKQIWLVIFMPRNTICLTKKPSKTGICCIPWWWQGWTQCQHHYSELALCYYDACVPWHHYQNNIMLFDYDSPITLSHSVDTTNRVTKGFYCMILFLVNARNIDCWTIFFPEFNVLSWSFPKKSDNLIHASATLNHNTFHGNPLHWPLGYAWELERLAIWLLPHIYMQIANRHKEGCCNSMKNQGLSQYKDVALPV